MDTPTLKMSTTTLVLLDMAMQDTPVTTPEDTARIGPTVERIPPRNQRNSSGYYRKVNKHGRADLLSLPAIIY